MSRVPEGADPAELTVVSRRVLLDALTALGEHLHGLTVVGAQAVYLRTADVELDVAGFTSDADVAVEPLRVAHPPLIDALMRRGGFEVTGDPGTWTRAAHVGGRQVSIAVDLLVPEGLAGGGRRSAELPPHDRHTARRVAGLEAVVHDRDEMAVKSLDAGADGRHVIAHVAGVAALLLAKAQKIEDRLRDSERKPGRLVDKDAGDVLRLFMATDPRVVARRFEELSEVDAIRDMVARGRTQLLRQFGHAGAPGVAMATRALEGAMPDSVSDLALAWTDEVRADRPLR